MSSLNLGEALAIGSLLAWTAVVVRSIYASYKSPARTSYTIWAPVAMVMSINTLFITYALLQDNAFASEKVLATVSVWCLCVHAYTALIGGTMAGHKGNYGEALGWTALMCASVAVICEVGARVAPLGALELIQQLTEVICIAAAVGFVAYIGPLWGMRGMSRTTNKS